MLDDLRLLVWSERRVLAPVRRPAQDLALTLELSPQVRRFEVFLNLGGPLLDSLLHARPCVFVKRPWRSVADYVGPLPAAPGAAKDEVRLRPPVCDAGFRVSKVEVGFPRIEPTCLYGLDDRIPPHFLKPHEPSLTRAGRRTRSCRSGFIPVCAGPADSDRPSSIRD